jgi:DNA mismatch endonuclease (patch repair protein)
MRGAVVVPATNMKPMVPSSVQVSERMSKHPRRDTSPELELRRLLHAAGLRYRVQYPVPGWKRRTIDIAFTRRKVAVFIDGCFWHGCSKHRNVPASNREWWQEKLTKNATRDGETDAHLHRLGWRVVRLWEHDSASEGFERVRQALNQAAL